MKYSHTKVSLNYGDVVRVTIDSQATVMLMDPLNYARFCAEKKYEFEGGFATVSPYDIFAPSQGDWDLVIHPESPSGKLQYSIKIIR